MIKTQQSKVIAIFGCNSIGIQVAQILSKNGHQIILCDNDKKAVEQALEQGLVATVIDYTDDNAIKILGIGEQTEILFAAFESDSANVFVTLSARWLDANLRIISLANSEAAANSLIAAGCNRVLEPYEMMGREIQHLVLKPLAMEVLSNIVFGDENLVLGEITLTKNSALIGCRLQECIIEQDFNLIFIGVINPNKTPQIIFSLTKEAITLKQDDILVVIGHYKEIERLKEIT